MQATMENVELARQLGFSPWAITVVVGLILCMMNLSRAPRISIIVAISLVLFGFDKYFVPLVAYRLLYTSGLDVNDPVTVWKVLIGSLLHGVSSGAALAVLLWAVFSQIRDTHQRETAVSA